ncbi:PL29 family lyase N-terminal domain-containing protein, partial [Bacteroides caccae]
VKVMFFGALALSTVTYVGCKDYDDDIDNLQTQIDANKADIAKLQSFVKEGKWVTNVEDITGGFKITFNDNKSYSITNGKDATPTKIEIDPVTKNWIVNDNDLGICAEGKKGDAGVGTPGKEGYAPQISEDGYWIVWNAEEGKPKKTNVKATTDIYVSADANNPLVWVLNILNKETGEWEKVSMPKSARITGMSVLGVTEEGTVDLRSTQAEATLYYHKATADINFNGNDKFKKAGDLLIARGGSKIHALINPVNLKAADIQAYEIGLTDSKGNTSFVVANIADNFSVDALTRVADPEKEPTANKGVYDLTLRFAEGVTDTELEALKENTAYALTTKDAWGNEIISGYDVKVKAKATTDSDQPKVSISGPSETLTYQETYKLDELFGSQLDNVVAYYYEVAKNENIEFKKDLNTIKANKETEAEVTVYYLTVAGEVKEQKVTLTFQYKVEKAEIKDMTWVVDGKKVTATSEIVGPSVEVIKEKVDLSSPIKTSIAYTDGKITINGEEEEYQDGIELALVGLDKNNKKVSNLSSDKDKITKFVIEATFKPATVAAVPHTATVQFKNASSSTSLGNEFLYETTFKITVDQQNDKLFVFKRATGYFFAGNIAKAYGTVPTAVTLDNNADATKISFDLYTLYQDGSITKEYKDNITFTEDKPYRLNNKNKEYAPAWLTEEVDDTPTKKSEIKVFPYVSDQAKDQNWGGAYTGRDITVSYAPFGNNRLNAITDKFNLTILSEIYEGSFKYTKEDENEVVIGTKDNPYIIKGNATEIEILEDDFERLDASGNTYTFSSNKIKKVTVEPDENAKTYLTVSEAFTSEGEGPDNSNKITISKKADAAIIAEAVPCQVSINILDKWGRTKKAIIYVKVMDLNTPTE